MKKEMVNIIENLIESNNEMKKKIQKLFEFSEIHGKTLEETHEYFVNEIDCNKNSVLDITIESDILYRRRYRLVL